MVIVIFAESSLYNVDYTEKFFTLYLRVKEDGYECIQIILPLVMYSRFHLIIAV